MSKHHRWVTVAIALWGPLAGGSLAYSAAIEGWTVHNFSGSAPTIAGTPAAPTITPADDVVVMAPFSPVTLVNDGDSITVSTVLELRQRSTVGINSLNTQLRFGLFNGPPGPVSADDAPNLGFIIEYSNAAAGGLIREQQSAAQTNPFVSPANIGNGSQDAGADSIQGANPGPVQFELTLTRNGGLIDLSGSISGTDSVSNNPYLASYAATGYNSANFPANGAFTFSRIGLFLGGNVNAADAVLRDSAVSTNVPEPSTMSLLAAASLLLLSGSRGGRVRTL